MIGPSLCDQYGSDMRWSLGSHGATGAGVDVEQLSEWVRFEPSLFCRNEIDSIADTLKDSEAKGFLVVSIPDCLKQTVPVNASPQLTEMVSASRGNIASRSDVGDPAWHVNQCVDSTDQLSFTCFEHAVSRAKRTICCTSSGFSGKSRKDTTALIASQRHAPLRAGTLGLHRVTSGVALRAATNGAGASILP